MSECVAAPLVLRGAAGGTLRTSVGFVVLAAVSRPAAGLMVRGSALRADSPRCSLRGSAAPNSLRSLRSLWSNSGAESVLEAREYTRLSRSAAPSAAHKSPVGGPSHLRRWRVPPWKRHIDRDASALQPVPLPGDLCRAEQHSASGRARTRALQVLTWRFCLNEANAGSEVSYAPAPRREQRREVGPAGPTPEP